MFRSIDKWLIGYARSVLTRPWRVQGAMHLIFCVADHFEPLRRGVSRADGVRAVEEWTERYARCFSAFRDSDGRPPRHTFFYPQEEYDGPCLDRLAGFCSRGYGEVEIHLHHRNDTSEGFRAKLIQFRDTLRDRHGLLGTDGEARARYGFAHGNWALCNSRPDGDWCGVNEELGILAETGCYADFTFPSAPSPTQPRMVNAIYYAWDREGRPRGHDVGVRVRAGGTGQRSEGRERSSDLTSQISDRTCHISDVRSPMSDAGGQRAAEGRVPRRQDLGARTSRSSLLLIQGPLALDWRRRKWGVLPHMENGAIEASNPPTAGRVDLWVRQWVHVAGRPDWVFVKAHTHGCVRENADILLGEAMRRAHERLQSCYNNGSEWFLHYATAREIYNMVRAAEDGRAGNPGEYRDYEVRR